MVASLEHEHASHESLFFSDRTPSLFSSAAYAGWWKLGVPSKSLHGSTLPHMNHSLPKCARLRKEKPTKVVGGDFF